MKINALRRKSVVEMSHFLENENLVLCELGTEQICLVIEASSAIYSYAPKHDQIRDHFFQLFCKWIFPVTLLIVDLFLQQMLDNSLVKLDLLCKVSAPTAFEAQLDFHSGTLMSREAEGKKEIIVQNAVNSMKAGVAVLFVRKD